MRPVLFSLPLELRCSSPLHQMFLSASCNHTYFLTTESSTDLVWRPRHEFSLPICPPSVSRRIGTSVTGVASRRLGTRLWGSKTDEGYLLHPILSALSGDQDELVEYYDGDHLQSKPLLDDLIVDSGNQFGRRNPFNMFDETQNFSKWYQPIEEPWLMESSLLGKYAAEALTLLSEMEEGEEETSGFVLRELEYTAVSNNLSFNLDSSASQELLYEVSSPSRTYSSAERQQPVEEPWFLCPPISPREKDVGSVSDAPTARDPLLDEKTQVEYPGEHKNASEVFMSDKSRNLLSGDDSILTEILINSSICTMQRIAVLEDGNLVEILLEPVKSIVQCDSVYLGAVTKLVPHMGGAFVNIGNPRPSLMDINHYREPFIFPPFAQSVKGKISNTSSVTNVGERSDVSHSEEIASDHIQTTDLENENHLVKDRGAYECDDFEDHEAEDDFDDEEAQTRNLFEDDDHRDTFQDIIKDTTDDLNGNGSYIKDHVGPLNNYGCDSSSKLNWAFVRKGTKIVVQVVKEGLGTKGPTLTAYPKLRSRFWVLKTRSNNVGISKKISGVERTRLRVIAQSLKPPGFGLTARTVAVGRPLQELRKDLEGLLSTWRNIMEHAKSAALAADEGVEGAVPVILHQAMSQTLSVVQDYFTEKVKRMIVDSPRTYHEVTNYLQELAPDLCDRVELHNKKVPLFDEFNIEEEIDNLINKRVPLPNGGSLVIEQTEALVSIDVNGGHGMFGQGTSQEKAVLEVNLAAAKQIARELRLRDIGGIIVVDFIDMHDDANKRLVYEEVKKAVDRDRSMVKVSELSKHGLMEITRKRVRPSVTFMISEPCTCCHGTGRVEALETSFSKIEHEICRLLASMEQRADPQNPKSWPRLVLRVDGDMCEYLTAGKKTRLAILSSSLKVWILMKVARNFTRGAFEVKLLTDEKHQMAALIEAGTSAGSSKRTKLFSVKKWKTTSSRAGQKMN